MKLFNRSMPAHFYKTVLLVLTLAGGMRGDETSNRLRIDRWTQAGDPSKIDDSVVQRLGEKLGAGHFLVANTPLGNDVLSLGETSRIFSFYSATSPEKKPIFKGQVLFLADDRGGRLEAGPTNKLLATFLSHPASAKATDRQISSAISAILSSALFGGQGQWLPWENGSALGGGVITRGASTLEWKGIWLREDGGAEEVVVTYPSSAADGVEITRRDTHPAGFFPSLNKNDAPFEEWTVDNGSRWHPSSRYKMMTTMAALGNSARQFQLATALLQESEEEARAEGLKWLKAAAAQGHRDAIDLLRQSGEELVRPDRDRDKVRVSRCCPVPGR